MRVGEERSADYLTTTLNKGVASEAEDPHGSPSHRQHSALSTDTILHTDLPSPLLLMEKHNQSKKTSLTVNKEGFTGTFGVEVAAPVSHIFFIS